MSVDYSGYASTRRGRISSRCRTDFIIYVVFGLDRRGRCTYTPVHQ
jgi:hypothetical protein